jgi:hypothetical protein
VDPQARSALIRRYQTQLDALAKRLGVTAQQAWLDLGSWNEADIQRLGSQLRPASTLARSSAAALSGATVSLLAGVNVGLPKLDPVDWSPAFNLYWKALGEQPWDEAVQVGARFAEATGFDSVQDAARQTTRHADESGKITAWAREPDGSACDWCVTVSGQLYHSADSADFGHDRCGCAVVPAA